MLKENLNLAGEYAVASELFRRDVLAQLTFGNRKKADILVLNEQNGRLFCVEVKAKQGNEFPAVKGITGDSFLVFVDFKGKTAQERPDFYVLSSKDWENYIQQYVLPEGSVTIDKNNCPTWSDGFVGAGVKPSQINQHKEKWEKLLLVKPSV